MRASPRPGDHGIGTCGVVFRVLAMIMWAAPVGAFGAIAAVVGETGIDALKTSP
jgi:aerobic C4-dicarboxylate transport protein